ncbi:MAG TPA: hypothetical protein VFM38_02870 [Candidatus Limnocylindrales bacterium]|nr:hypothetical protein [Candidatus Limnocylindrales bacterium]
MGAAVRLALSDLYYNSIRLVPANIVWAVGALAIGWVGVSIGPLVALLLAPLLAFPMFAVARLAGLIVRRHDVVLSDAWDAVRQRPSRTLLGGILTTMLVVVLAVNIVIGLLAGSPVGLGLAVMAGWGALAILVAVLPFWVILADPQRSQIGVLDAGRLAAGLLLVRPGRLIGLTLILAFVLLVATALMAALLTVGLAYAALLTARIALPLADRIAGVAELAPADG